MKICKKCKLNNPNDAKFCRGCGKGLDEANHSVWKVIFPIVVIAVLVICIYAISESTGPDYPDKTTVAEVTSSNATEDTSVDDTYDSGTHAETETNTETDNTASSDYNNSDDESSSSSSESSQSIYRMVEVQWTAPDYTIYRGLIVILNDFTGIMKVTYCHPQYGITWITQEATLTNYTDGSSIINCNNPQGDYASTYSADNFKIFPNGTWYTQDGNGVWSMAIVAASVGSGYWSTKLNEYGLN